MLNYLVYMFSPVVMFVCYPVLTYNMFDNAFKRCSRFKLLLSELSPPIILLRICSWMLLNRFGNKCYIELNWISTYPRNANVFHWLCTGKLAIISLYWFKDNCTLHNYHITLTLNPKPTPNPCPIPKKVSRWHHPAIILWCHILSMECHKTQEIF